METLRDVILNENVFAFVNVINSVVGMLTVVWLIAQMKPISDKD